MKLNIGRTVINLVLILVAAGLLWYIVQAQNLLEKKTKPETSKEIQVEVPFSEKNYSLDYKKFDPQLVENIGLFTKEEKWVGSGFYDKDVYFEYPSSLYIAGGGGNKITNARNVHFNLSKILSFDFLVNRRSDLKDLESATLSFTDQNAKTARYVLPRTETGWNVISFPKEQVIAEEGLDWTRIVKISFEAIPRPMSKVVINIGSLRGQPGSILYNDWNVLNPDMLALDKRNGVISLLARNIGSSVAVIKRITKATNFSYQSSYTPLNNVSNGLFFRGNYQDGQGYYLLVSGINGNQWQLHKLGKDGVKVLAAGEIANFSFRPEEKYYLKAEVKGNNIKAYFSLDGASYTLLADVSDEEFLSGGVGVTTGNGGAALFNDFEFSQ